MGHSVRVLARALLITGTLGVGKTTIAENVCRLLATKGEPHAFLDLDALSGCWPRPADDPFNSRLVAANLAAVAANFSRAGARSLVLSGVVETQELLDLYEQSVGRDIVVVRLTADPDVIEERLRGRYGDKDTESLEWHLDNAPVLADSLDASALPMKAVENSGEAFDVARTVLAAAGW